MCAGGGPPIVRVDASQRATGLVFRPLPPPPLDLVNIGQNNRLGYGQHCQLFEKDWHSYAAPPPPTHTHTPCPTPPHTSWNDNCQDRMGMILDEVSMEMESSVLSEKSLIQWMASGVHDVWTVHPLSLCEHMGKWNLCHAISFSEHGWTCKFPVREKGWILEAFRRNTKHQSTDLLQKFSGHVFPRVSLCPRGLDHISPDFR